MDVRQEYLMNKRSIETDHCPFCGRPVESRHHIVPRSQGGANGPTVTVCGHDNVTGCHGRLHQHTLHLDWNDAFRCWEYIHTKRPMRYLQARMLDGWVQIGRNR